MRADRRWTTTATGINVFGPRSLGGRSPSGQEAPSPAQAPRFVLYVLPSP